MKISTSKLKSLPTVIIFVLMANFCINAQTLDWANRHGSFSLSDHATAVIHDDYGNVYVIGYFWGTVDFDPGSGVTNLTSAGFTDIFIQKLDSANNFIWAHRIGGTSSDHGTQIAVDNSGNVYTAGSFKNTVDFDPGLGTANLTSAGGKDIFVQKLDSAGNLIWAKNWGGNSDEGISAIAIDDSGNIYSTGSFFGINTDFDPGPGSVNLNSNGVYDIYIHKMDSAGNFLWVKQIGGSAYDYGMSISLDDSNNVYVGGEFAKAIDFDPGADTAILNAGLTGKDAFILKLDKYGNFVWAKNFGGGNQNAVHSITLDDFGNVITTGYFKDSADFDTGVGTAKLFAVGSWDIFVMKMDLAGNFIWVKQMGGGDIESGSEVRTDKLGNIYVTGDFSDTVDFDPGAGTANRISQGQKDLFVLKLDGNGNLVWAHAMGGTGWEKGNFLSIDNFFNIYICGYFRDLVDFSLDSVPYVLDGGSDGDIFVMKWKQTDPCTDLVIVVDSVSALECNTLQGFASAYTLNGNPPYTYSWNTNPISYDSMATMDSAAIYQVTVTDAVGCVKSASALINGPKSLTNFDLSAHLTATDFRPGFPVSLWLDAFNDGCLPTSGQLKLVLDTLVSFNNSVPAPDLINGDTLIWNFISLAYDSNHFLPLVSLTTNTAANMGDLICLDVIISPSIGDIDAANNDKNYCYEVVNSYDPNDKQVYPAGVCDVGYIENESLLTYTVRFQNTGTAEAININIIDTIDTDLDMNTVRVIGQSHPQLITEVLPDNVLKFRFDNILLPDSNSNEPESHGYVIYEAELLPGWSNGTLVTNSADIYFDLNPAVKTNTVINTVVDAIPVLDTLIYETTCDSYTSPSGVVYSTSGIYVDVIPSVKGCDSTITIDLTISMFSNTSSSIVVTACNSYTAPWGSVYDNTGTYTDVIPNTHGCDSTITVDLTVIPVDMTVDQSGAMLTSNAENLTYQWLDCGNGMSPIAGETNQSFTASKNGNYAVALIENTCTDTSTCYSITSVGVSASRFSSNISIYPNPTEDKVTIQLSAPYQKLKVTLLNVLGQEMKTAGFDQGQLVELDMSEFRSGVYFVEIMVNDRGVVFKVIKE